MRLSRYAAILSLAATLIAVPAQAAIQYNNKANTAPFAASSTAKVGSLLQDFAVSDINSSTSISAGAKLVMSVGKFFTSLNDWLKEKAGIDLFAIFKTLGHWFIVIVEWLLGLIKGLM